MYTASITKKNLSGGTLQIEVEFANGTETFIEAFNVTSEDDLNNQIKARIEKLNNLADLETKVTLGTYTLKVKEVPEHEEPTDLQKAENKLYELKRLIELRVVKETDQEFVDAVTEYKNAKT